MMKIITTLFFFLVLGACVDRLQYDIAATGNYGISVDGFISNEPGPYRVNINQVFDIDSKEFPKVPVSLKRVTVFDNEGSREELSEISPGVYETQAGGIRGQVGNVYTLKLELFDGRVYESVPDTLFPAGSMDSIYYEFTSSVAQNGRTQYGFDIFSNSSRGENSRGRFLWNMTGTFQSETHPERVDPAKSKCFPVGNGLCNFYPPCSGIKNIGSNYLRVFVRDGPCTCCTCWYNIFNEKPLLSESHFSKAETFSHKKLYHVPVNGWIFMHKIRIKASQLSLSARTFSFWKAVVDQQNAVGSLFQPVSGKIPINFVQTSGAAAPVQGLFYATSISSKSTYITRDDVPSEEMIPAVDVVGIGEISCLDLFPNATITKPSFWMD